MSNVPETPVRSPSYPIMPLADAITSARKIEAVYRVSKVDREAAAKMIGYSGLSGPANKALAALAQYGLVERAGKGEMRITARARAILHPDNDDEKRRELRSAAFEPQLFKELQERWPDMHPPEDGVIMYLNRKGFNQSAIRPAAKAYLQTLLFLEEAGVSDSHGTEPSEAPDSPVEKPMPETAVELNAPSAKTIAVVPGPAAPSAVVLALNKVHMDIKGDVVLLNAMLDYRGLAILEKKIANLKALMEPETAEEDDDADPIG